MSVLTRFQFLLPISAKDNKMQAKKFCHTFGALDSFDISGNTLVVAGWVVSLETNPVTELRLSFGDIAVGSSQNHVLPSPDVLGVWPSLRNTESCRFEIKMELLAVHLERVAKGDLISVTPYVGEIPGIPFERFWPLILSSASAKESDVVGRGDFVETSFSFLALFRLVAGLQRDEKILDAGCGIGRMAFALGHYLNDRASYDGFDVTKDFVDAAKVRFREKENFNFQHVDIFNKMYNKNGQFQAANFAFPFASCTFSFVFLTSVFTHMLTADVQNYLREIKRVLRDDGRCFATFFIIDDEVERLISEGSSTIALNQRMSDGCIVENTRVPENAVGYREGDLRKMVEAAGMRITQLHRGQWPGRTKFLTYQDVCLLEPA